MDLIRAERLPFLCRRNYVCEFQHLIAWGVVAGVVEGNLAAVVVTKTFGGGPVLLWLASTTHVAMFVTSLLWGALCVGRRKIALMTVCVSGVALALASVAATPHSPAGGTFFVAQMAAAQFFITGVLTIRPALWKSNYPAAARGQIIARFQMVRVLTAMGSGLAAAQLFDQWPGGYRLVYPLVAVAGLIAATLLRRVRVRGEVRELARLRAADADSTRTISAWEIVKPHVLIRETICTFRQDPRFGRYCASLMSAGIGNLLVRAVVIQVICQKMLVDLAVGLRVYVTSVILLEVLPKVVMLGSLGRLGRWFDRIGILRFRVANGVFWLISISAGTLGTLFVVYADRVGGYALTGAVLAFAIRSIALGVAHGGGSLAYNLGHLHFAEPDRAEIYMGIHVTLSGIRGLIMPGVGLLLWGWIGWPVWLLAALFSAAGLVGYASLAHSESVANNNQPAD